MRFVAMHRKISIASPEETKKQFKDRPDLYKEFKDHKDELVLDLFKVVRLIGIGADEEDLYWQFNDGRRIFYSSCVGGFIPLKGKLDKKHYKYLDDVFKMNDVFLLAQQSGLKPETLKSMDKDMKNFAKGKVSAPIDLTGLREKN